MAGAMPILTVFMTFWKCVEKTFNVKGDVDKGE